MHSTKAGEKSPVETQANLSEVVSDQQTAYTTDESAKRPHLKKFKQNWRINLLSMPKSQREKYAYPPDVFDSGVAAGALKVDASERVEHMSRPPVRILVVNKRQFKPLHKDYEDKMDRKIESSWNSIYNAYKKARRELSRKSSAMSKRSRSSRDSKSPSKSARDQKPAKGGKKGKDKGKGDGSKGDGGKGDSKKGKDKKGAKAVKEQKSKNGEKSAEKIDDDHEKHMEEWCELRAKPKKVFRPEPIARGPIADLSDLANRMLELSTPKKIEIFEEKDPTKISPAALTYQATGRILELAKPSQWRVAKEDVNIPGTVKPEALQAAASERIKELATPKVTQNAKDSDIKEDPFAISPNALKYVATDRIKELAKPIDR